MIGAVPRRRMAPGRSDHEDRRARVSAFPQRGGTASSVHRTAVSFLGSDDPRHPGCVVASDPEVSGWLARLTETTASQDGVVARAQLRQIGVPRAHVRGELRARRWRRIHRRTYVTFSGPVPFRTKVWAAVLYAGEGSVASHGTAAFLQGVRDAEPVVIEVLVGHGHRVGERGGLRIRQCRRLAVVRHPSRTPPQTWLEDTVLDLTDQASTPDGVVDIVLAACQRRLTTAGRLAMRARGRKRLRWRRLLGEVLSDVREGVLSALERRYFRDVERAHGLPRGRRNRQEGPAGRRRYRDVRYRRWKVLVELDGLGAHPAEKRELDDLRDNEVVTEEGGRTLRYGWRSVAARPCAVAEQVAGVLQAAGWTGTLRACGGSCTVVPTSS